MKTVGIYVLLSILLSACSNQAPNIKQYYRLKADFESSEINSTADDKRTTVLISRPKTLGILGGRPMVATKSDGALVQLNNHYWLESPTVLLHNNLVNWAENHWQNVTMNAAFDARLDRLDTTLLAFEKDGQQAKVSIQFVLHDSQGSELLNQTWQQNQTINGDSYAEFVSSINQAVSHILLELSRAIKQL